MANELKTQENFRLAFNELDYDMFIIQFERFLKKSLRSSKSINAYMKDIKQYIGWNNFKNIGEPLIVNEKKRCSYKLYLKQIKNYENSTIKRKLNTLEKLNEFIINFNTENWNRKMLDENAHIYNGHHRCKRQYNYITKTFIKL